MTDFIEILKYILPAIIVFLTAYFLIRNFLRNEEKRRRHELTMNQKDSILPLRLQAYERLILLLERISPDSLVMRTGKSNLSAIELQNELINIVRMEFEHNIAQQTYISNQAWEQVKTVKTQIIKLINESALEINPNAKGIALSKRILENAMSMETHPAQSALQFLKKEVQELF